MDNSLKLKLTYLVASQIRQPGKKDYQIGYLMKLNVHGVKRWEFCTTLFTRQIAQFKSMEDAIGAWNDATRPTRSSYTIHNWEFREPMVLCSTGAVMEIAEFL